MPEPRSLPDPVLLRELSAAEFFAGRLGDFRQLWQASPALAEMAPDFDTWMLEAGPVQVVLEAAAYGDLNIFAEMNKWARVLLIAYFAKGNDLDLIGAREFLPRFDGEDDAHYWDRIISERRGKMCYGADPWYVRHAKNADKRVLEVAVTGNRRRRVEIAILSKDNGGVCTPDLIEAVTAKVTAPGIPRNNDIVEVVSAVVEMVDIVADITLLPDVSEAILEPLPAAIRAAWASGKRLGRDLVAEWIKGQMMVPGVYRPELRQFSDVIVPSNRAVALGTIELNPIGRAW